MSRATENHSRRAQRTVSLVIGLLVLGSLLGALLIPWDKKREKADTAPLDVRGEPINAPVTSAELSADDEATSSTQDGEANERISDPGSTATNTPAGATPRRKREKPGSYPQRLVKSLASGKGGTNTVEYAVSRMPPTKIVPIPPLPPVPGFQPVTFAQLAGFPFKVDDSVAFAGAGSTNGVQANSGTNTASMAVLSQIPESLLQLDGRKVALQGFLVPLKMDDGLAVEFLLVRDQTFCCYGKLPQANEWVLVRSAKGIKPDMDVPLTVCGQLRVGDHREDGIFVGIYRLEAEKVIMDSR